MGAPFECVYWGLGGALRGGLLGGVSFLGGGLGLLTVGWVVAGMGGSRMRLLGVCVEESLFGGVDWCYLGTSGQVIANSTVPNRLVDPIFLHIHGNPLTSFDIH
jgi:hypothetical protein